MRRAILALVLTASMLLAGCTSLEDLTISEIPQDAQPAGWSLDEERSDEDEASAGPITVAAFATRVYTHENVPQGTVAVVTVSDVPLADVDARIRSRFQQVMADQGVQRSELRSGTMTVDGFEAEYTLYEATIEQEDAQGDGYVLEYTYGCDPVDTVVGFLGFAITEVQSGGFGGSNDDTWEDVAGPNWQEDSFDGMSKDVDCKG